MAAKKHTPLKGARLAVLAALARAESKIAQRQPVNCVFQTTGRPVYPYAGTAVPNRIGRPRTEEPPHFPKVWGLSLPPSASDGAPCARWLPVVAALALLSVNLHLAMA